MAQSEKIVRIRDFGTGDHVLIVTEQGTFDLEACAEPTIWEREVLFSLKSTSRWVGTGWWFGQGQAIFLNVPNFLLKRPNLSRLIQVFRKPSIVVGRTLRTNRGSLGVVRSFTVTKAGNQEASIS